MFKKIYLKYLLVFFSGMLISHILLSTILATITSHFYQNFMINVRKFNPDEWSSLSGAYFNENIKHTKRPILLILGTSFSYALDLNIKDSYSNHLASYFPHYKVMNASVIGDSGMTIFDKIHYLKQKKLTVDTLIIELNLFNFTSTTTYSTEIKPIRFLDSFINSNFAFYFLHPKGVRSFAHLDLNRVKNIGTINQEYTPKTLPNDYVEHPSEFEKKLPMYQAFLENVLTSSKEIAQHVYFFIAPIYADGIKQSQFKLDDIRHQLEAIHKICHKIPGIHCLNPGFQFPKKDFMNVVHFNAQGHQSFAGWLADKINESTQP